MAEHPVQRRTHSTHLGVRVGVPLRHPHGEGDLAVIERQFGDFLCRSGDAGERAHRQPDDETGEQECEDEAREGDEHDDHGELGDGRVHFVERKPDDDAVAVDELGGRDPVVAQGGSEIHRARLAVSREREQLGRGHGHILGRDRLVRRRR